MNNILIIGAIFLSTQIFSCEIESLKIEKLRAGHNWDRKIEIALTNNDEIKNISSLIKKKVLSNGVQKFETTGETEKSLPFRLETVSRGVLIGSSVYDLRDGFIGLFVDDERCELTIDSKIKPISLCTKEMINIGIENCLF